MKDALRILMALVVMMSVIGPSATHADETPDCRNDVASGEALSTPGGRYCREKDLKDAKAGMQQYYERTLRIAEREDSADKETFGSSYQVHRAKTLIEEQKSWEAKTRIKCEAEANDPTTTGYPAALMECEADETYKRLSALYRRSVP